jgi:hypothetical protein
VGAQDGALLGEGVEVVGDGGVAVEAPSEAVGVLLCGFFDEYLRGGLKQLPDPDDGFELVVGYLGRIIAESLQAPLGHAEEPVSEGMDELTNLLRFLEAS